MLVLTTSIPTPRPETSVTSVLVEKPGAKIRFNASESDSLSAALSSIRPFDTANVRNLSGSIPLPSSVIFSRI